MRSRPPEESLANQSLPGCTLRFFKFVDTARQKRRSLIHTLDFRPLVSIKSAKNRQDLALHEEVLNAFFILDCCRELRYVRFLIMDGIDNWELDGSIADGIATDTPNTLDSPLAQPSSSATSSSAPFSFRPVRSLGLSNAEAPSQLEDCDPFAKGMERQSCSLLLNLFSLHGCSKVDGMRVLCLPSILCETLTFLDISYTATSERWLQLFAGLRLPNIRVLKLRGLRLTSQSLPKCIFETAFKLWSLDLRDNLLTDEVINPILHHCFLPSIPEQLDDDGLYHLPPTYEREPVDHSLRPFDGIVPLRPDTKDAFLNHIHRNVPSAMDESDLVLQPTGLTHLYLSNNRFTSEGPEYLLYNTNRLQVFDIGSVREEPYASIKIRHVHSWAQAAGFGSSFHRRRNSQIASLRVHHSIVTFVPTISSPAAGSPPATFSLRHLEEAEVYGRLASQKASAAALYPSFNCGIETLTLTGIPTKSYGFTIQQLVKLLDDCYAQEVDLARARPRTSHRRTPQVLPGLRTLRLEFVPADVEVRLPGGGGYSVSGDPDADAFLANALDDFSFFESDTMLGTATGDLDALKDVPEELRRMRKQSERRWSGKLELVVPATATATVNKDL